MLLRQEWSNNYNERHALEIRMPSLYTPTHFTSFPEDTLLREMFLRGRVEKRTLNEAIFKQE